MSELVTPAGALATLGEITIEVQRSLALRLVVTVPLSLAPRALDPSDSDRLLAAGAILTLDGDLFVTSRSERALVGGLRHLYPALPLRQEDAPRQTELQLFLDLSDALARGLAPRLQAGGELTLTLRGLAELWENPLYDADGYQKMRVGDSGLSRALQAMGQREHVALSSAEIAVTLSKEARSRAVSALGTPLG